MTLARIDLRTMARVEPRTLVKPCVCGGTVRADRWEPREGVHSHQRTTLHQEWRRREGIE